MEHTDYLWDNLCLLPQAARTARYFKVLFQNFIEIVLVFIIKPYQ